jgi:imidazole glycerol phosphate synthase glutamine amidotransferase subunit
MDMPIGVINLKIGNPKSIASALERIGVDSELVDVPENVTNFAKIILPGVGNFGAYMENLNRTGFTESIKKHVSSKAKRILGLCVGAQALLESSEEDLSQAGLGFISGLNRRIAHNETRFLPRTGWDYQIPNLDFKTELNAALMSVLEPPSKFYFSHSFRFEVSDPASIVSRSKSDPEIATVLRKENILGAQFHPEKSLGSGLKFLEYFARDF